MLALAIPLWSSAALELVSVLVALELVLTALVPVLV